MDAIVLKNVSKSFKIYADRAVTLKEKAIFKSRRKHAAHHVLKDLNITIKKGEVVGLIGKNGCGKSTTLKLMTRILYPDKGSITVNGRVSSLLELGAGFHPDLSGRDNIYANAAIFGLSKKETDSRLKDIIAFSELEDYIDNPVRTYSSGMYMRLAFSVAINVDADILLIDEILAVGDSNFQTKCFKKLYELKNKGITIVIVTHDSNTVEKFCNRAIWLNHGEIVADGNQIEVVDKYRKYMNDLQVDRMRAEEASAKAAACERYEVVDNVIPEDANRFGNGNVEIIEAFLTNSEGKKTTVLKGDEDMNIHIRYKIHKKCAAYIFGMGFYTMNDVVVYGNNTMLDGEYISNLPDEGTAVFHAPGLRLLSGDYKLNVSVIDENEAPLDFYRCYMVFTVVSNDKSVGVMSVPHHWEY